MKRGIILARAPPSLPRTTPMRISATLTSLFTLRAVASHSLQTSAK
uniref:SulA n=1 Tax=Rhizophora mucronata TaxID=61149 RepID=A0A2P2LJ63_RHIMU